MRRHMIGALLVAALVAAGGRTPGAQQTTAMVRTHQGDSYRIADPSLEIFYTIGEPKEKKDEELQKFGPTINVTARTIAPGAGGEQMASAAAPPATPEAEKEEKLLRGHSRVSEISVWKEGVENRLALERIRTMLFVRRAVDNAGLPPYITHYRYGVSVTLVDGERIEADYVNLGTAVLRGTTPNGSVDIPWEEIQNVIFGR